MRKKFNITGWCNPERHFMADVSSKSRQVMQMIEDGEYFTINRPHQYGKTTMLEIITRKLLASDRWLVFHLGFQNISSELYREEKLFCRTFMNFLEEQMIEWDKPDLAAFLKEQGQSVNSLTDLSKSITAFVTKANRKVVLLIDEVDKSSNNQLFMDFLGILRHKFLKRHWKTQRTFHSVVLTGVQDIKTLKLKIRPDAASAPYNSPWNIAVAFKVDMSFQPGEIVPMLEEYAEERGVGLDAPQLAGRLFYLTSGYPFLVSGICKVFDEEMLPAKKEREWTEGDLDRAAHLFVTNPYSNTNFDHLIKNLENYPELYQLVFNILIAEQHYDFNIQNPTINMGCCTGFSITNRATAPRSTTASIPN